MPVTVRLFACQNIALSLLILGCGPTANEAPKPANTPVAEAKQEPMPSVAPEKPVDQPMDKAEAKPSESPEAKPAEPIAPAPVAPTPPPVKPTIPATQAEAAKVIDLRTFPVPEKAVHAQRTLANLSYNVESKVSDAFKTVQQQLLSQKWEELPNSYLTEESSNGTFSREGYKLSLSVIPLSGKDQAGQAHVSLMNHGNLNLSAMPLPAGTKLLYGGPVSAMYTTDASVEGTLAEMMRLLTEDQWLPYGMAGDVHDFKRNAVRLSVRVLSAPAQDGKTMIDFSSVLLSVNIPLPPKAIHVQYSESPTQLGFDLAGDQYETVSTFYRDELAKQDWKATTENLVKIDWKDFLIFRNPQKDLMEVQLTKIKDDDLTRAMVRFKTAEEVAEEERRKKSPKKNGVLRKHKNASKKKPINPSPFSRLLCLRKL